jgi:hypothetical protein
MYPATDGCALRDTSTKARGMPLRGVAEPAASQDVPQVHGSILGAPEGKVGMCTTQSPGRSTSAFSAYWLPLCPP